jgi:hypothetical protein
MNVSAIVERLRQTPNRGNLHIFLGHQLSDLCDKTTVEPGNGYSPGVWTCGVVVGLVINEKIGFPDALAEEQLTWGFAGEGGAPPIVRAAYTFEGVNVTHELCQLGGEGAEGVDFNRVTLAVTQPVNALTWIAVRPLGPAGGKISRLEWLADECTLLINQTIHLTVERPPVSCQIFDSDSGPLALLCAQLSLAPGQSAEIHFKTEHGFDDRVFSAALPKKRLHAARSVASAFVRAEADWRQALPARVFAPDRRIEQVWQASAYHILAAMEGGLPRIGVVNYPVFWMRDSIIILRALDLIGRSDLARIGNDYLQPLDFSGGFGAESDAPGEGIWALVSHAQMHPDRAWLVEAFPHIRRRVGYLKKMIAAVEPMRAWVENRTAVTYNYPGSTILCLPAQNGCIHGRMDWHSPDFYINCWALAGLRQAVWAAEQLGETALAAEWQAQADTLERAVGAHLLPIYDNERDPAVAPYPTEAFTQPPHRALLQQKFSEWFRTHRLTESGERNPEKLWTYFEAAHIHNAIRLGLIDLAWTCLDGMLTDALRPWNVAAWVEGPPGGGENIPFGNRVGANGWLSPEKAIAGNMPHNWTSGEMLALLRTIFVLEEGDTLLLGRGAPRAWLRPGSQFGVRHLPTRFGPVTYTVTVDAAGQPDLVYAGPQNYRVSW